MEISRIEQSILKFTVPIFIRGNDCGIRDRNGTGVLVGIQDRFFVFTAGHCIDAWASTKEDDVLLLPLNGKKVPVSVVNWKFHYEQGKKDFGFIELSPENEEPIKAVGKTFLPEQQLDTSVPDLYESAFILGFPEACNDGIYWQHALLSGSVYPKPDPRFPDNFQVWVSKEELEKVSNPEDPWLYSDTSGLSGGGCWFIRNTGSEQEIVTACLAGIHFHADRSNLAGQKKIESRVTNHLKMIHEGA